MILDNQTLLAGTYNAQNVLTALAANGAGTIIGNNVLDLNPVLGAANGGDAAQGLDVMIQVVTAPTVGTSVQFQLVQADDTALTTNVQVLVQSAAFAIAQLPAGSLVPLRWDRAAPYTPRRYFGLRIINVGAIATASYIAAVGADFQNPVGSTLFKAGYGIA